MAFYQIRHRRLYEEIVDQVKAQLARGELRPGDRMLSEREIAERLGVSRAAVREALAALEVMGLLEVRPGEGAFVRAPAEGPPLEPLTQYLLLERGSIAEMYELRHALEVSCAGQAALRARPAELAAMARTLDAMAADVAAGRRSQEADFQFHLAVAAAAHNSLILGVMNTIADSLQQVLRACHEQLYRMEGMPARLLEEHRRIYEAIQARDPQAAREEMGRHLDGVANLLLSA